MQTLHSISVPLVGGALLCLFAFVGSSSTAARGCCDDGQTSDASAAVVGAGEATPAQRAFERLKSLAGDWLAVDENGEVTGEIAATYRVTAGGSAVLELEFPGSEHEMVTLYSLNRGKLELRHYCVLGNQPLMIANAGASADEIVFDCNGEGGNLDCAHDQHMHHGHLRFPEEGRITSTWKMLDGGEEVGTYAFEMVRKPD